MTRKELMLHLLREAGDRGMTTSELLQAGVGSRYGARLHQLRDEGFVIQAERIRDGAWRYTLTGDPERVSQPKPAADPPPDALFETKPQPLNASLQDFEAA